MSRWTTAVTIAAVAKTPAAESITPGIPTEFDGQVEVARINAPWVAMNPAKPRACTHPPTAAALATESAITGHAAIPAAIIAPGRKRAGWVFTPLGYAEIADVGRLGQRGPRE